MTWIVLNSTPRIILSLRVYQMELPSCFSAISSRTDCSLLPYAFSSKIVHVLFHPSIVSGQPCRLASGSAALISCREWRRCCVVANDQLLQLKGRLQVSVLPRFFPAAPLTGRQRRQLIADASSKCVAIRHTKPPRDVLATVLPAFSCLSMNTACSFTRPQRSQLRKVGLSWRYSCCRKISNL